MLDQPQYIVFGAPSIGEVEISEVVQSMRSGWLGTGPKVARFEKLIAEYIGAPEAIAVNSCTAALHLSLLASGIGPGDEVITTPLTFCATANAIIHTGATPVFVDCDRRTGLLDPELIDAAVTDRTRAVLPVHLTGRPCDLDAIADVARKHGLLVIEDAAHALEAQWRGRKVGAISPLTCFSFYVTKNLTTGEGGMVTTHDRELAARIRTLALHGLSRDAWKRFSDDGYRHYEVIAAGFKYNMMDLQAAIGLAQVPKLQESLSRREEIWRVYDEAFADLPVETPAPPDPDSVHARHLYTLHIDAEDSGISRDAFMHALHRKGIGTGVHYVGVHLHAYYRERFGWQPQDFPNATWISDRTVSLPLGPGLTDAQVERIVTAVRDVLASAGGAAV